MRQEDTRGVHLWLILWKATRSIEAHAMGNISSLELCYSDFAVLEALLNKGELPVNTIGKKVLLTSGSITTAVDRLEQRGLVERKHSSDDRRARIVGLTKQGRKLIEAAFVNHEAAMEHAVSVLSANERATLARLLKKVGKGAAEMLVTTSDQHQAAPSKPKRSRA